MRDKPAFYCLTLLLLATFAARAWKLDQPIVENYVGRQIPTAMVARNLDKGLGFLHPQLDTGPFPNYFVVEPPIYQELVVFVSHITRISLSESGRLVSALATAIAAWGLFGLVRRREGNAVAVVSVAVFSLAPITLRFGRAFQPDMLMLGLQLAGLRLWDATPIGKKNLVAPLLLATSLAMKITSAVVLVPLFFRGRPKKTGAKLMFLIALLLPAACWYAYAATLIASTNGSRASTDNLAIWAKSLLESWNLESGFFFLKYVMYRSFTPIGFGLTCAGLLFTRRSLDRFWPIWGASAIAGLVVLGKKAHHEYYWLAIAPIVAFGAARCLIELGKQGFMGRTASATLGLALMIASTFNAAPTWRSPAEWSGLRAAGVAIRELVPRDALVVAPEALLFESDRRGARLEFEPSACERSAGEWGGTLQNPGALSLVDFFQTRGIRFVADAGPAPIGSKRRALRDSLRSGDRSRVLVDRPDVFLAALTESRAASIVKETRR